MSAKNIHHESSSRIWTEEDSKIIVQIVDFWPATYSF